MKIGTVGLFQACKIAFQQLQRIVSIEQCSTSRGYLFIAWRVFDGFHAVDIFLCDLIDGQLINSVDGVIVYFLVLLHPSMVVLDGEDDIS